jgi:hypothetical protein
MSIEISTRRVLNFAKAYRVVLLFGLVSPCLATSQHEAFTNAIPFYTSPNDPNYPSIRDVDGLHLDTATLDNPRAAKDLLMKMRVVQVKSNDASCPLTLEETRQSDKVKRGSQCLPLLDGQHKDTYVLIHLLKWASTTPPGGALKVQADHWYLYRDVPDGQWSQEAFTSTKRLMGVNRLYVLLLHVNPRISGTPERYVVGYTPNYDFTITKKTPSNVAHLYALLQAYTGGASVAQGSGQTLKASAKPEEAPPLPDAIWGGGVLNLQYRPSDILIKSTYTPSSSDSDPNLADDITFDNEGPYWWDVGFAVPVKKISDLKLDSTSGTATPAKVNTQNVFSVFDFYLKPVDVKGSSFMAYPHPIAGVAFAKQPLHKILVGGAWGPKTSEIYVGAVFVKQPSLSGSNSCSNPTGTSFTGSGHWCTQLSVGINLSVSAIASKLSAPK